MEGLERMFASRARKHGLDPETMSFGFSCDPPEPGKGNQEHEGNRKKIATKLIKIRKIRSKNEPFSTLTMLIDPKLILVVITGLGLAQDYENICSNENSRYLIFSFYLHLVKRKRNSIFVSAVVAYVRQNPVDLIVIGCRGLSKLKKAFIGSVSDYVIRHSGIPVLTVPLNQQQQQPTHQQRNNSMT